MKKLFVAAVLATAACGGPALATDIGISIRLGDPGFYGQLDPSEYGRPRLIYGQPVLVERRYRNLAPIYLRVPANEARNWRRYCDRYNACTRPVYFVRDDWYRDVYAPRYRQIHGNGNDRRDDRRDERRDDRRDERRDDRRDDRDNQGRGNDRDRR
jgi:hypothetical protein